jgi:tetrahydromethanopterin S-methyltransferase subunit G
MLVSKMSKSGKVLVNIGGHWVSEDDIGEVMRRFKEINASVVFSDAEKKQEIEKVLKEFENSEDT